MTGILPPNATALERALSGTSARLSDVPVVVRELWNPDACPAAHLPWLAWALSVDDWNAAWSDAQKRAVVAASYTVHTQKGTVGAMRAALGALGYAIELAEWFQESPPAAPYTFGVTAELGAAGLDARMWDEITAVALSAKNARSHLRYVRLRATVRGPLYVGGTTLSAEIVEVQPYQLREIEPRGPLYAGAALIVTEIVEILPLGAPVLALADGTPLALTDGALLRLLH